MSAGASSVIDAVRGVFAAEALPVPPLPVPLAGQLRRLDRETFGTRRPAAPLYDIAAHLEAAAEPEESLLLGFDGHGVNSWAVHYYLSTPALLLLVQRPWGGAYMDAGGNRADIAETFAAIAALLDATAHAADRLPPGRRLAAIVSAFGPSQWAWLDGASFDGASWQAGTPAAVIAAAEAELQAVAGGLAPGGRSPS
ncbi:MAG: hypothetical protein U1E53_06890 [Dongiaceae bacterium]